MNYKVLILSILFLLSISLFLGLFDKNEDLYSKTKSEQYDSNLNYLNSTNKLSSFCDSIYNSQKLPMFDTLAYTNTVSDIVKKRFHFGLANYYMSDNWITYLFGKMFWSHFLAIVSPDDILKHSNGLCSQQTIVFMEILKLKGIHVRSVGLGRAGGPGHFVCEAKYNLGWHVYDVTKEPKWERIVEQHNSLKYYISHKDSLYIIYNFIVDRIVLNKYISQVKYGEDNTFPATKMLFFHRITYFFSFFIPILLLIFIYRFLKKVY